MSILSNAGPWGGGQKGNGEDPEKRKPRKPKNMEDVVKDKIDRVIDMFTGGGGGGPFEIGRGLIFLALGALAILWVIASLYRVYPSQQSVELLFGEYYQTGTEGLNFAPWPAVTREVHEVTEERTELIGIGSGARADQGLMLTGDENIVDIDFQVVWNINDLQKYLFTLTDPSVTIRSVAESAMREVIGRSQLSPILNRDRGVIADEVESLIQTTLDSYGDNGSGINIIRVNLDKADPPNEVINSFREVQAAEQTRDTLEKQADAYSNRVVAGARGKAAQFLEEAEGYRAQVVNEAEGEASRFLAVYEEYSKARDVTRKRLYIETLERVLGDVVKIIIDEKAQGGQGVVPYLPLNELRKR